MTTTPTSSSPVSTPPEGPPAMPTAGPPPTPAARSMALLGAAAGLVVVVIALVLVFGVARPPALTSLADDPLPGLSAEVAWTAWEERGTCVHVASPNGTVREVTCAARGEQLVSYDEQGLGLIVWGQREQLEVLDADTGDRVELRSLTGIDWERAMEGDVDARRVDGRLVLRDRSSDTVLWEVEAPEGYWVSEGRISPDGAWMAAVDSADRLIVLPTDGATPPRVWHEGVDSWQAPVWEGTAAPDTDG